MKPSSAKSKGRLHQQWVRKLILSIWPEIHEDDVKSTSMGAGGEDLTFSNSARKLCPVSIECKSLAKFAGYTIYDQAVANAPSGAEPIGVIKANKRKPIVLVDAEYFFKLLKDRK